MTACTSPLLTTRSIPWRISLPSTPARRPRISSVLTEPSVDSSYGRSRRGHHDVAAIHRHLVHGDRPGGGKGLGLAVHEGEGRPVLPTFDLPLRADDLALGER